MAITTKAKTVYTADAIAAMIERYTANKSPETVAAIAADLGVTAPSVRSKLASLGVYEKAKPAEGKRGKETKEILADSLRTISGLALPNIEAAGRDTLTSLLAHFNSHAV